MGALIDRMTSKELVGRHGKTLFRAALGEKEEGKEGEGGR